MTNAAWFGTLNPRMREASGSCDVAWVAQNSLPRLILFHAFLFLLFLTIDKTEVSGQKLTSYRFYVNGSNGYIQTPGFPRRFPTPISCQWLIHAPPGKKIVLYFTQYYMRESFKLTEYDYYKDPDNHRGKHDLGEISFEDEVTSYTVYKSYLMLSFHVHEIGNIHLRVYDFLLEVYGFNITYEIMDRQRPVRTDACSVFKCSFLGNCLATRNFETYKCHCFAGFFGEDCQYGPYCDPDKGINMCRNQGKCRYFYGSLVNTCECPPGYYGVLCEKKQEDFGDTECEKIGCEQKCIKKDLDYLCDCHEGYRLAEDNKTCIEKGRMRYHIQARCRLEDHTDPITPTSLLDDCPKFKGQITERITSTLVPRLQEIGNFSITDISLREEDFFNIEILFFGEKADTTMVRNSFYGIIRSGRVCNCRMDHDFMNFDAQPALHMLTLENYDSDPVLTNHLLTLVCRVKGSDGLHFKWLKDGAPVYVHRTKRNMWITNIPTSDGESRMSVLNVDHADMLDEGVFTCMATDWGETKAKSVEMKVTPKPNVEVTPMVTTVMEGEETKLQCLSGDDKWGDFRYVWFRGNERIGAEGNQEEEVVEDLFPVGSRLTIKAGSETQVYTCEVTAPSGQANSSAQVTVTKVPMETRSCPQETYFGVTWQQTAANQSDLKLCPHPGGGRARRYCACLADGECDWEEPDFSRCTSPQLRQVAQELKKLELGYMVTDVPVIIKMLEGFLKAQDTSRAFMGDMLLSLEVLNGCHSYLRRYYPANTTYPEISDIIKTASVILDRSRKGGLKERKAVSIGAEMLKLFGNIRRDKRIKALSSGRNKGITTRFMDLQVSQISSSSKWDTAPLYSRRWAAVTVPLSLQSNTLARSRRSQTSLKGQESTVMVTAVYENLQELLSNDSLTMNGYKISSQIVSVGPYVEASADEDTPEADSHAVDIRFNHYGLSALMSNITACLHWIAPSEDRENGEWARGKCTLLETRKDSTSCRCRTPGHYVVVTTSDKAKHQGLVEERVAAITLTGSTIALIFMVASLLVHILLWRKMKDDQKVITVNICIFAICLIAVLMATFIRKPPLMLCRAHLLLGITFFTGSFAFITLELVYLRFILLKLELKMGPAKILLTGYGVVVCVIAAILVCGQVIGYSEMSARYCWIVFQTWELYALIAPTTIILLVYTVILILLLRDVTCLDLPTSKKEKRKYLFFISRSTIVVILVSVVCIFSITMVNNGAIVYQSLYAISIAAMGIFFFVAHCLILIKLYGSHHCPCVERLQHRVFNKSKNKVPNVDANGSVKAFLKPEEGSKSEPGEDVLYTGKDSTYKMDKSNYIKDRKDQMKALLGNSSDSTGSSKGSDTREIMRTLSHSSDSDGQKPYRFLSDIGNERMSLREDSSAESQRSGTRENHNALCDCGKCGSDLPFKPTRGKSFIMSDEQRGTLGLGEGSGSSATTHRGGPSSDRSDLDSPSDGEMGGVPTKDMLDAVPSYVRIDPLNNDNKNKQSNGAKEGKKGKCRQPTVSLQDDRPC